MAASDVAATLKDALKAANLTRKHRSRLLSDNGPYYISGEFKGWLSEHGMTHTRGKPYHPMTQGKIERWHRTMKDKILLEHYYMPSELENRIGEFINHYNTRRYHESLNNLTPEDVWLGRGGNILEQRRKIKAKTMTLRKQLSGSKRLLKIKPRSQKYTLYFYALCPKYSDDVQWLLRQIFIYG